MRWLLKRGWMYLAMIAIAAFALFPIYWIVITSLKPRSEIYTRTPDLWPSDPQWDQYPRVLGEGHVGRALMNSLIVASGTMVLCLLVSAGAAYVLARYRIRITRILLILVLMTQMFPLVVLVIPLFVTMRKAGLLGTYWSLVITYLAFSVPLAIWVMRGFVLSIPEELEHAARIDGATRLGAMWRVVLPLAAPGLAVTAVLSFLEGWKEFLLALTFINDEERKTTPLVLQTFVGRGDTDWGAVMATSVLYTLPVAVVFVLARKHLMTGPDRGSRERMRLGVEAALVDGALVPGDVEIDGGSIARFGLSGTGSGIAAPGFIDLQVNGFAGVDLMATDHEGYVRVGEALLATGTTAFQPTFVTAPEAALLDALRAMPVEGIGARVLGAHLEGPFLSPRRAGVHDPRHLSAPDLALLRRLLDAAPGGPAR